MKAFFVIILVIGLIAAWWLLLGAIIAFLWNALLVGALQLALPTINLWAGIGIVILLTIVGSFFRR